MKCSLEGKCKRCVTMKDGCYFSGKALKDGTNNCLYFISKKASDLSLIDNSVTKAASSKERNKTEQPKSKKNSLVDLIHEV